MDCNDQEPELEEIDLPPMITTPSSNPSTSKPHFSRKRTWDSDFVNSSDPAVFSSDDHTTSVDEYASKRRKHHWKGTWWGEKAKRLSESMKRTQREFKRNYDSGIFMGSEGTESSIDDEFLDEQTRRIEGNVDGQRGIGVRLQALEPNRERQLFEGYAAPARSTRSLGSITQNPSIEQARLLVQRSLEDGNEILDLSGLWLHNIPNSVLEPLRSLTKYSSIRTPPTSQEAYESLEPELRIFLSNNLLNKVPSELFNLSNLRVLSLRHNKLTEIPAAVARLDNLEELNVGGNELQYLPWQVLQMTTGKKSRLKKFSPSPNPFTRFHDHEVLPLRRGKTGSRGISTSSSRLVARTSVTFFNVDGSQCRQPPPSFSKTPSLLELSLRHITHHPCFMDIISDLQSPTISTQQPSLDPDADNNPTGDSVLVVERDPMGDNNPVTPPADKFTTLLQHANGIVDSGRESCPTCSNEFIVLRAEWVEWWDITASSTSETGADAPHEGGDDVTEDDEGEEREVDMGIKRKFSNVVPFRKRVCSYACVDREI